MVIIIAINYITIIIYYRYITYRVSFNKSELKELSSCLQKENGKGCGRKKVVFNLFYWRLNCLKTVLNILLG